MKVHTPVSIWKCHDYAKGKVSSNFEALGQIGTNFPTNFPTRQMAKLCVLGFFVLTVFHLFSPWKLVIQKRSALDSSGSSSHTAAPIPVLDDSRTKLYEQSRKKDYIERDFGSLEDVFIKSIGEPSGPARRSRDDSIKLIYDTNKPSDWLDLVGGHDDHVCPFPSPHFSAFFLITVPGPHDFNKSYAALYL